MKSRWRQRSFEEFTENRSVFNIYPDCQLSNVCLHCPIAQLARDFLVISIEVYVRYFITVISASFCCYLRVSVVTYNYRILFNKV